MTAQHQDFADMATEMIAEDGRPIQLVTLTKTGPDYQPVITESVVDVMAVQSFYDIRQVNGDLIQKQDRRYLIDGVIPITPDMRIRDDGVDYSIVGQPEVKPGTTSILYKVQARL